MTTKVSNFLLANTAVIAGIYGASAVNTVVAVDAQGRITSLSNVTSSVANTNIVGLITDAQLAGSQALEVTGVIKMWPTATAPTGYLVCNGQAVSRTTFAALFSVLGTTFGVGNGSTTFNVPNYTNRMPIGAGDLYSANTQGGSRDAIVVSHSHSITDPGHAHQMTNVLTDFNADATFDAVSLRVTSDDANYQNRNTESSTTGISIQTQGVSGTNANLPPYIGIHFIIKT
jgi:microcystin-dependent protein